MASFASEYFCIVSSAPSDNVNFCRALSSGNGDMCFTSGPGPACSSTGQQGIGV